jgi:hypothetical protein
MGLRHPSQGQRALNHALASVSIETTTAGEAMPNPDPLPPAFGPSKKGDLSCLIVFTCVFLGCVNGFLNSLRSWQEETQLSKEGILITGSLTDRRMDVYNETCHVSYRFLLSEPKAHTQFHKQQLVGCYLYEALDGVRFVDVRYLPEDPRVSRLELNGSRATGYAITIVLSLVGGALGLLAVLCEATGWKPLSKRNQWVLDQDGVWRSQPRR